MWSRVRRPASPRARRPVAEGQRYARLRLVRAAAAAALLAPACGERPAGGEAAASSSFRIEWHDGDVASAFGRAEREERPLFLYWGAAWCPPCQYLEQTVFRRPEFVARSRRFVNVYLDGDTEGAQRLGEELGVHGYPSVVLFDAEGRELTRIPNLPIDDFVRAMDLALERAQPVRPLLEKALHAPAGELTGEELAALAFYAWDEDPSLELAHQTWLELFRRLDAATLPEMSAERSRFFVEYLSRWATGPEAGTPVPPAEATELSRRLTEVVRDPELARLNLEELHLALRFVPALYPEPSAARDTLIEAYVSGLRRLADDPELPWEDRLNALFPIVELHPLRTEGEALPDSVRAEVAGRIQAAAAAVRDEAQRQSVWNRINALARRAGLAAEAEALLTATMDSTLAPFYWMWLLAGHAERDGRGAEAVEWRRRAYEASEGSATRFESGRYYLETLLRLTPEDVQGIETESRRVLGDLLDHSDAFANRNREGLNRLEAAYRTWAADDGSGGRGADRGEVVGGARPAALSRLREYVRQSCPRFPDGTDDSARARCLAFLAPGAAEGGGPAPAAEEADPWDLTG